MFNIPVFQDVTPLGKGLYYSNTAKSVDLRKWRDKSLLMISSQAHTGNPGSG